MLRGQGRLNPRLVLTIAIWAIVIGCFAPLSWTRWAASFGTPVTFILAPIQHPVRATVISVRAPSGPRQPDPAVADIVQERDRYLQNWLQSRREIDDLRTQIRELSRGLELNPDLAIRQLMVPVIGGGLDTTSRSLRLKAGRADGLNVGDVAVTRGVHVVGRISRVEDRSATLLPITDPSNDAGGAGAVQGAIMLDESRAGPTCNLAPAGGAGEGRLAGKTTDTIDPATGLSGVIQPGMLVRLNDPAWPASAQMLILGEVEKVEPDRENPLRPFVTVKPVHGLERLPEVVMRLDDTRAIGRAGGPGAGGAP